MSKPKTCRAIHPNKGVELRYRKALQSLIEEMANSAEYWISAQYKKASPEMAEDESPAKAMINRMSGLSKRWIDKFNDMSDSIAEKFATGAIKATDNSFKSALKDAGWVVEFKMTAPMRDAMNANIQANVALIKSIPQQYFTQIEGIVMRGYERGGDLADVAENLREQFGVTHRRAAFIARDQNRKMSEVTHNARRKELGIKEGIWRHSGAGKHPRKDHQAANGRRYNLAEGCKINGKYIQAGEEINCRCGSESVLPF